MKRAMCTLLAAFMLLGVVVQPALGDDGYETLFSGDVKDGDFKHVGDYFLRFGISNGSSQVNVTLSGPSVPSDLSNPRYIPAGQCGYYPGMLRVYVDHIEGDTAYVEVARPSGQTTVAGTKVSCDVPGQTALGGDVVSFPILIQNNNPSDHTYSLSSFSDIGWKTWFEYGDKGVYKISVPARQPRTVNLMVQTWGNTPVGEKKVVAYVDDIRLEVFVDITSANQSADVSFKVGSKIASIGDKITYDLHIKNVQPKENIYRLSVAGLPDNWYARYLESATSVEEMAEVVIPASSDKDLVLEIVPPYSVSVGSYNFTAVVTTPEGVSIKKDLTLTLKSSAGMSVTSSRLAYETKAGQAFDIVVYVSNSGQGTALTNVYIEATAPQGWLIQASPNRTNSIKAGETQTFTLTVQPPGNIVASDYEVNVKVKSDQAEKEKDYRVTVKADSYVPYLGAGILIIVIVGLAIMYKKYGRR
ncbi:COG1470 family protein [Methanocella conradii]|uniref:COG1470 family protein n=1 Tax=Methanocella conradii TaxID=1175444 RepID=UPI00157E24BA|nr:NEW3 domain-containing protein [Methanocella conradii]